MSWRQEFDESYDVPEVITNDPLVFDNSWHNDVCPSYQMAFGDNTYDVRLWVNHPDPKQREMPEWPRFQVTSTFLDETLFETETNVEAALEMLKLFSRIYARF